MGDMSKRMTARAQKVLELALREALQLGHTYIGTEHLLLGLVREGEGVAAHVLRDSGVELEQLRKGVVEYLAESGSANLSVEARLSDLENVVALLRRTIEETR